MHPRTGLSFAVLSWRRGHTLTRPARLASAAHRSERAEARTATNQPWRAANVARARGGASRALGFEVHQEVDEARVAGTAKRDRSYGRPAVDLARDPDAA